LTQPPSLLRRAVACTAATLFAATAFASDATKPAAPHPVKVMIVTLFGPEAAPWLDKLAITRSVRVPGLSADYPEVSARTPTSAS
jgi:purine nucleoside permease